MNRRSFLARTLSAGALASLATTSRAQSRAERQFTVCLNPGAIGVSVSQMDAIRLAANHGFESVEPVPSFLVQQGAYGMRKVLDALERRGLVWGAAGLPVDFRREETVFQAGLSSLPDICSALQRAGVTRVGTWIMPNHAELTYEENFELHRRRLADIAGIMGRHGLRLGLEYVGPKTLWSANQHEFVHTMSQTKQLIAAIGHENVGFVLDSFHWYTAWETQQDLLSLKNEDVVACDLNDARPGLARDEQIDNRRELPTATGVIDMRTFVRALVRIGYDGPVRAEPFNQPLREMARHDAVAATSRAMYRAAALV